MEIRGQPKHPEIFYSTNVIRNSVEVEMITLRKFQYALENNTELNELYQNSTAETAFCAFLTIFNKLYEQYFPVKQLKLTRKGIHKPWVNITLISRMKIKDNLFKLSKRNLINRKRFTFS